MSIIEANKIDSIGTDKLTGEVILTISDHLDWKDDDLHLETLQNKLNSYIEFIEGEQIFEAYPNSRNKKIIIEIISKYEYNESGNQFLMDIKPIIESLGVKIRQKHI